jgi:hypothetical protein
MKKKNPLTMDIRMRFSDRVLGSITPSAAQVI